jgi:predicted transcriptional regulator
MMQRMTNDIPSALHVRAWLLPLAKPQLQRLSDLSGVPFGTLWKIRSGDTEDPRIETVRRIAAHLGDATKVPA